MPKQKINPVKLLSVLKIKPKDIFGVNYGIHFMLKFVLRKLAHFMP
jgi:hypothetical protein